MTYMPIPRQREAEKRGVLHSHCLFGWKHIECARLRQTAQQAESLMFVQLPGRLAKTLLCL